MKKNKRGELRRYEQHNNTESEFRSPFPKEKELARGVSEKQKKQEPVRVKSSVRSFSKQNIERSGARSPGKGNEGAPFGEFQKNGSML